VIDDILTTGATARSVAQVLLEAGAATVWIATLARARRAYDYGGSRGGVYSDTGPGRERGRAWEGTLPDDAQEDGLEPASKQSIPRQPSF
jgi:hypothetical protein